MKIINKSEFLGLMEKWISSPGLIAPVNVAQTFRSADKEKNLIVFKKIETKDEVLADYLNTVKPVKDFFLPPSTVFDYERKDEGYNFNLSEVDGKETIIFGLRPCDAKSITLLDKVFSEDSEYKDSNYAKKREKTVLVGLACTSPDIACFCTSMGISPFSIAGLDALIINFKDSYVINTVTDKGKNLLGSLGKEAGREIDEEIKTLEESVKLKIKKTCNTSKNLESSFESEEYWTKVSNSCLSCGVCTFLCPNCYCFDLSDESAKRIRCWNGCVFLRFALMSSGENPRATKKLRYRHRVFHKFKYFREKFGENLCVGCGRCIRHCPVKIDIAEVVNNA